MTTAQVSFCQCSQASAIAKTMPMLLVMDMDEAIPAARRLLAEHGATGPIRWLHEGGEWVFIITTHGAANVREAEVTRALVKLLGERVWITTDGAAWARRGAPL